MNRRSRPLVRALVRFPGCLVVLPGLLLGAAGHSSAATPAADHRSAARPTRVVPLPPGAGDREGAVLTGQVTPVHAEVEPAANGDFVLTVTNTGTLPATDVRVLLDDASDGNGVGSADGRCLSRLDGFSPADLWCELGDLAPRQTATVAVHAYMFSCLWLDPAGSVAQADAAAFFWRIGYTAGGRAYLLDEPAPQWSCAEFRAGVFSDVGAGRLPDDGPDSRADTVLVPADLDIAEAGERP
ncbi:hypothetical protein [Streptomyces sp.]|uniref:hypothetical protein n=1 Tax=Streptomyces sp. TaxID=1931 RepID=UPI002F3E3887